MVSGDGITFDVATRVGVAVGGGASFTVRRTVSPVVPPGPVAVATYVTDDVGVTWRLPLTETIPNPGSMVTLVAFWVVTVNVADWPRVSVGRSARRVIVGGAAAARTGTAAGGDGDTGVAATTLCLHENEPKASKSRNKSVVSEGRE